MTINISGILKSPQGSPIQNAEIIFEQTRTSTEVLAGTKFSIITNQSGNYSTTIGVGTFVFKVRFQDEIQYRTVASNVIVTQSMNNYTLNQIIQDQSQLQDVDYDLLQDVIQARDQAAASAQAAQTSQSIASTKASEASSSAQNALASKDQAQTSEANALQSKNQAQDSEQAAQQSQAQASLSQGVASSKALEAANSASEALSDKNAAQQQADSALSSKTQAESFQQQADNSQQQQQQSQVLASSKAGEAQDSQVSQQSDQLIATNKAAQASSSQAQAQSSQNTAITKAEEASTSQADAQGSQLLATTKAQESSQSQILAQRWAANPENTEVSGGLYSALHYAAKAAQSAQTAMGQLVWRGGWSAQSGVTPPTPSGTTQDFYRITQAGTILGVLYEVGDYIHWDNINSIWFKMDGTDSVVSVNGRTGQVTLDQDQVGALPAQGTAVQSHKLATARAISITGDGTGSVTFDGSADQQVPLSLKASGVTPGVLTKVTVNQKGIVTQGEQLQAQDIPNLDWSKITTGKPTTLQGYGITDAVSSTGVASAANKLAVPRQINGTNFDGTQGITTEVWGSSRQITIGNTQKDVNGSQPVSWSLSEIGAVPEHSWNSTVKLGTWSPVCRLNNGGQLAAKMFITVGHTRGNFVSNAMFLVSCGHAGNATITQLESHGYSQISVRLAMVGDNADFEILDEDYGVAQIGTEVQYSIKVHGLYGYLDKYTAFTASTGIHKEPLHTVYKAIKIGNDRVYTQGFKPTPAEIGAFPSVGGILGGPVHSKQYVIAESDNGSSWVGIEAPDNVLPYISAKVNNLSRKVMEFTGGGDVLFAGSAHVQRLHAAVWGDAIHTVGGKLRSDNTSFLSLDGKTYSFVTSIGDAHLCQNSYWNGVDWLKYDPAQASGHLVVSGGQLRFKHSDAGSSDPLQHDAWVYHTGHRPTPADIGAYTKDEVDSLGRVHIKDVRGGILPPDSFATHNMSLWFSELNGPTGGWYSGINMRGWGDAYASWQLVSGSDIPDLQVADASKTALWFRSGSGAAWGEYQKVYTTKHKPTSEELNVIGINKKNILNNTNSPGVGFISAGEAGAPWVATYHGTNTGDKVVIGTLNGCATVGAHNGPMDQWSNLYLNCDPQITPTSSTIIGNPYARKTGSAENFPIYHAGNKPTLAELGAAPSGYGLGTYGTPISTILGDNSLRRSSGYFQGSNIAGIPTDGHTWKYVFSQAHGNAAGFFGYLAIDFAGSKAWIGAQEAGTQRGPYELVKRGDSILAGGRVEINSSANPTLEFHIPGKYAVAQYLDINGNFRIATSNGAGGEVALRAQLDGMGDLFVTRNGSFNDVYIRSDSQLKHNRKKIVNALQKVGQLQGYTYDKRKSLVDTEIVGREAGIIAQDLRKILPEAVREIEDTTLTISNSAVTALLVEAIKELKDEIDQLRRTINGT